MFLDYICQNIDILAVINVQKNFFGFHSNQKTEGHKHLLNNLCFKYQVYQMKLRHLNSFLQHRLLFHEPHCTFVDTKTTLHMKLPTLMASVVPSIPASTKKILRRRVRDSSTICRGCYPCCWRKSNANPQSPRHPK